PTPTPTPTDPPKDLVKPPQANKDFSSLVIGVQISTTGNLLTNDQNSTSVVIQGSLIGKYGALSLGESGTYIYTVFERGKEIESLVIDQQVTDVFKYSAINDLGQASDSTLTIQIISKKIPAPQANEDFSSLVIGVQKLITGNVLINDQNAKKIIIKGSLIGKYGALSLGDSGEYTYTIFERGKEVENLAIDKQVTDVFKYSAINDLGQASDSTLTIQIISKQAPTQPSTIIARDDSIVIRAANTPTAITTVVGNVINNDSSNVNESQQKIQSKSVQLTSPAASEYGFLILAVDGQFTYALYDNAKSVSALKFGSMATDRFNYTYFDEFGQSATATLSVSIIGNPVDAAGNTVYEPSKTNQVFFDAFTIRDTGDKQVPVITGKVTNRTNENNKQSMQLKSVPTTKNGFIVFKTDGSFTYTLYRNAPSVLALKVGENLTDSFSYTYLDKIGKQTTAKLNISILGNPLDAAGNTIYTYPDQGSLFDNVDIEFNDRSAQATPLNSSKRIRGHLHRPGDKDWYSLTSRGDEVITLEMCPRGSSCFGQKNWVLYVFDSNLITKAMEMKETFFKRFLKETGTTEDSQGNELIEDISGVSNHMYLAYQEGYYNDALIGIVDPCFDKTNAVHIGVDKIPRNYFFAVSSTLNGSKDLEDSCGQGRVVLKTPDGEEKTVTGKDKDGEDTLFKIVNERISSRFSDDQYIIKVTGTGLNPLLSEKALVGSAAFDPESGTLIIPKINIFNDLYEAKLSLVASTSSDEKALNFGLNKLSPLPESDGVSSYHATYDSNNKQVIIPRVTNKSDGKAYSIILQYLPAANGKPAVLKVISIILIK
ncbi:MAG: VCBS domain-containing protein, partial [Methylococcales bacterium]|nr:VCBS domain-containing protein [Methylococcales bacterium]